MEIEKKDEKNQIEFNIQIWGMRGCCWWWEKCQEMLGNAILKRNFKGAGHKLSLEALETLKGALELGTALSSASSRPRNVSGSF